MELSNKLQLPRPKHCTDHCLTGSSFRMAWLRDFEPSQRRASRPAARGTDCTTPLRNHGISASLQGHKGTVNPPVLFQLFAVTAPICRAIPHGADRAPGSPLRLRVICCHAELRRIVVMCFEPWDCRTWSCESSGSF